MKLDDIRIVLVGTTHPGNIGSVARAMKTMCLSDLRLVAPKSFPDPQATANAAHADDVLARARVYDTLEEALVGAKLVVGLTARERRLGAPALTPRGCATEIDGESDRHPVALLFGREHSGLTNEEIDRCQRVVHIPANPEYSALNLAAAVQVMCYELHATAREGHALAGDGIDPASFEHLEGFYRHIERICGRLEHFGRSDSEHLMRRLRRLFNRARPEQTELDALHGILSALERRAWRKE